MKRKMISIIAIAAAILQSGFVMANASEETTTPGKPTVGIAWREDTDSEFYTNICKALEEAGAEPVLLDMVFDKDLEYKNERISEIGINADDYLTMEYASIVKENTYQNSNVSEVVKDVDAVIFTGGEDISPTLLKEPTDWHHIEEEKDFNATRDVSDYLLMSYCIDTDMPVMGFCRGMQMLSVVSGASLIQDVPAFYEEEGMTYQYEHRNEKTTPDSYRDYAPHDVEIKDMNTLIYDIFGEMTIAGVPSWHHQAVRSVEGTKLEVTASMQTDGYEIVEAVERTDKSMIMGFQFHPEASIVKHIEKAENADSFMDLQEALKVFDYLVDYCEAQEAEQAA